MQRMKNAMIVISCGLVLSALNAMAQSAPSGARVQQIPLSGRQGANTVSTQQNANSSFGSNANTIHTSIQVQGKYQGSVPDPHDTGSALNLTLGDAIQRGLQSAR
jgi:hypothetical protein